MLQALILTVAVLTLIGALAFAAVSAAIKLAGMAVVALLALAAWAWLRRGRSAA